MQRARRAAGSSGLPPEPCCLKAVWLCTGSRPSTLEAWQAWCCVIRAAGCWGTGAASGIGCSIATAAGAGGMKVMLADLDAKPAEAAGRTILVAVRTADLWVFPGATAHGPLLETNDALSAFQAAARSTEPRAATGGTGRGMTKT